MASSTLSCVQEEHPEHAYSDVGLIADKRSRTVQPDAPSSASTPYPLATPFKPVAPSAAPASASSTVAGSSSSGNSALSIAQRLPSYFWKCRIPGAPGPTVVPLCLPIAQVTGPTKSARIMSAATGFPTQSMTFPDDDDEFYLFMDLRAQLGWASSKLTCALWVEATSIYNAALEKKKPGAFRKTPRALVEKLAQVEKQVIHRKKNNNYICEQISAYLRRATN